MQAALAIERRAAAAVWVHKRLWLLQAAGNIALLALGYGWLWIPEESVWQLAGSALLALVLLAGALWLHGGSLAFFRQLHATEGDSLASVGSVYRVALRWLPALVVWAALLIVVLWFLDWIEGLRSDASAWVASWLTMTLWRPISPQGLGRVFSALVWLVNWFVIPLAALPVALQALTTGFGGYRWQGLRKAWKLFRRPRYWLAYGLLFVVGAYLPYRLVSWVPEAEGFFTEAASLAARFSLAYVLVVTAWLVLLSLLGRMGGTAPTSE